MTTPQDARRQERAPRIYLTPSRAEDPGSGWPTGQYTAPFAAPWQGKHRVQTSPNLRFFAIVKFAEETSLMVLCPIYQQCMATTMKYKDTRMGFNAPIDQTHHEEGAAWQVKQLFERAGHWLKAEDESPGRSNVPPMSFSTKVAALLLIPGMIAGTDPEGIGKAAGRLTLGFRKAAAGEAVCPPAPTPCSFFTQMGGFIGRWPQRIKSGFEDGLQ